MHICRKSNTKSIFVSCMHTTQGVSHMYLCLWYACILDYMYHVFYTHTVSHMYIYARSEFTLRKSKITVLSQNYFWCQSKGKF